MRKKVLILGVAQVQGDAILQLKEMGHEVHAIAQKRDGKGADDADFFEEINFMDTNKVIEYIKDNSIDAVYSVGSDIAMPQASKIANELGLPIFVTEETAKMCNNKNLLRQTLGRGFNGNVDFQVLEDKNEKVELEYPFIMKPSDSQGQRGIFVVNNHDEFMDKFEVAKSYSRSKKVILEQYIRGPEISVNCYMVDGKLRYMQASDRITWEKYFGLIHKHVLPGDTLNEDSKKELLDILEKASIKLGILNGPMYAQVKVENNKPYIIEITPRLDGCHMWNILARYTNVNLLKLTFEHLLDNDTSELDKYELKDHGYTLEFICQEPNTKATYVEYEDELKKYPSDTYYKEGDMIRPVNNRYEKIGYFIYES